MAKSKADIAKDIDRLEQAFQSVIIAITRLDKAVRLIAETACPAEDVGRVDKILRGEVEVTDAT